MRAAGQRRDIEAVKGNTESSRSAKCVTLNSLTYLYLAGVITFVCHCWTALSGQIRVSEHDN